MRVRTEEHAELVSGRITDMLCGDGELYGRGDGHGSLDIISK